MSASTSFMSKLRFWSPSSSNAQVASDTIITDIEAQLPAAPTPAHTTTSSRPPSASYDPEDDCTDAIDDFFGVTYTREERRARRLAQQAQAATHASRHDAPVYVPETQTTDEKEPPAYDSDKESDCATVVAVLPSYADSVPTPTSVFDSDESDEPWTVPQGFFRYGFCTFFPSFKPKVLLTYNTSTVFPLLWFLGALLLINFHSTNDLTPFYTPEESAVRVRALRKAEKKWAYRCLLAAVSLLFLALVIVGATFMIMIVMKRS